MPYTAGLVETVCLRIGGSCVWGSDDIKAVDGVARPRHNDFVGVRIANLTSSNVPTVMRSHPPLLIWCKSSNASCSLRHDLILTGADDGVAVAGLAVFIFEIPAEHSSVVQKAVKVSATQGDVLRLARRTGDAVEIKTVLLVRYQWRRRVTCSRICGRMKPGVCSSISRWRICG